MKKANVNTVQTLNNVKAPNYNKNSNRYQRRLCQWVITLIPLATCSWFGYSVQRL